MPAAKKTTTTAKKTTTERMNANGLLPVSENAISSVSTEVMRKYSKTDNTGTPSFPRREALASDLSFLLVLNTVIVPPSSSELAQEFLKSDAVGAVQNLAELLLQRGVAQDPVKVNG